MALAKLTDIQKLALECYEKRNVKFSRDNKEILGEDILRNEILSAVGGEWNFYNYQENKYKVFRIVSEVLTTKVNELTADQFSHFCEVRDFALGDKIEFTIKNKSLFRIANIADGKNSTRRQRLLGSKVPTTAFRLATAIYEEFDRFITGRIVWSELVERVATSFQHEIAMQVSGAISGAYDTAHANLKVSSNFSEEELRNIIAKVKGATGMDVQIFGTPSALAKVTGAGAIADLNDKREMGYVKVFEGTQMLELPQTYNVSSDAWGVKENLLMIVPNGEKIVRLGFEGDLIVDENTDGLKRDDAQVEMFMARKMHLGVISSAVYGAYEII